MARLARLHRLPEYGTRLALTADFFKLLLIHQAQRLRWAGGHAGRLPAGVFAAQIAFLRQLRRVFIGGDHFDSPERTADDAVLTANTFFLLQLNTVVSEIERLRWAGRHAGCVVTVVASGGTALFTVENNVNAGHEIAALQRPVILIMGGYAGNLTGMTTNTAGGISDNKSVHWLPFYYSDIH